MTYGLSTCHGPASELITLHELPHLYLQKLYTSFYNGEMDIDRFIATTYRNRRPNIKDFNFTKTNLTLKNM